VIYLILFFEFFKTGLFAIGGGLATLPFLYDIADNYDWLSRETVADMVAIAESTPGPIGVNMSTYSGYTAGGIPGALIATLALVSPSIITIIIVARILSGVKGSAYVEAVFKGLRPAASGLIAAAGFTVLKLSLYNDHAAAWYELLRWKECLIFAVLFVCVLKIKAHPVIFIAVAGVAGAALGL
jgi:chromate transporter